MDRRLPVSAACLLATLLVAPLTAQQAPAQTAPKPSPKDTEVWEPEPRVVTPGATGDAAPSDAVVLFGGQHLDEWVNVKGGGPAGWTVADGVFTVKKPVGNIQTRRSFGNYQLHLEWRVPANITGQDQGRGNSGLFLASTGGGDSGYELQILDSYNNRTYANGQAGSIYKQAIPLANAMRKPGEWNVYDVVWTAPTFKPDGSLQTPARVTAFQNGVLIQNNVELTGETVYIGRPTYKAHGATPIKLQAHGDPSEPLSFRNIWIRELK
jgi:Domain of Unknown Function (DUF1080)